jgi:glucan phosphoethanolaminetransferase (alkaline phosphatase superfamily)
MKTYEKLTKAEREKLNTFLQYTNSLQAKLWTLFAAGCIIFAIAIPLLLIFTIPIIYYTGCLLTFFGVMIIFAAIVSYTRSLKYLYLIFGYKNTWEDVFDVTQEDIKKIKITKIVKWIWRKEE